MPRHLRSVGLAGAVLLLSITALVPGVVAQGASVYLVRGGDECGIDAGDIPGVPEFTLASLTVVARPNGSLLASCSGSLPAAITLGATFQGEVLCVDDGPRFATGHIVATSSGRVSVTCLFPAAG
jgi:hypothetical protein